MFQEPAMRDFSVYGNKKGGSLENPWLVSFADLMVQLMAFFALVFYYNPQNQDNFHILMREIRQELGIKAAVLQQDEGILPGADSHEKGSDKEITPPGEGILAGSSGIDPNRASDLEKLVAPDEKIQEGPDEGVRLRVVTFRGSILFDEGSSVVKQEFMPWLQRLASLSRNYQGYHLVLEGHAAPRERSRSGGGDVWALSGERAQAVARRLISLGIQPAIMVPESRGDSILEGDIASPEGRELARQVKFRFQRIDNRQTGERQAE
jgi:flagellar motor protein MotB